MPNEASDMTYLNLSLIRTNIVEFIKQNPKLALRENTSADAVILTLMGKETHNRGTSVFDEAWFTRMINDTEINRVSRMPFRLALLAWISEYSFPQAFLKRAYEYALGTSIDKEEQNLIQWVEESLAENLIDRDQANYFLSGSKQKLK